MRVIAEWKKKDMSKSPWNEREQDYVLFEELTLPDGSVIGRIEQFTNSDNVFYATVPGDRSGPCFSYEFAKQWCEMKTGNKVQ